MPDTNRVKAKEFIGKQRNVHMLKCKICGGKIKRWTPEYLRDDPPYPPDKILCLNCGKEYMWKEYQEMRCDKLVEMMGKNEI